MPAMTRAKTEARIIDILQRKDPKVSANALLVNYEKKYGEKELDAFLSRLATILKPTEFAKGGAVVRKFKQSRKPKKRIVKRGKK
jgi:hypothetical protein